MAAPALYKAGMTYTVAALYRFTPVADPAAEVARLKPLFTSWDICGTLLVAPEGINGTLAGPAEGVEQLVALLERDFGLPRDEVKLHTTAERPFQRLKVRLKKEIVTLRQPQADPTKQVGQYVNGQQWNALMDDPDVIVLDTRNLYEVEYGTFENAVVPPINKFTEFVDYVRNEMADAKNKKIAMFCTGGIRCEKASSFMLAEGFPEVYHLKGGILKYLADMPAEQSRWQGTCFVFDERVALGKDDVA